MLADIYLLVFYGILDSKLILRTVTAINKKIKLAWYFPLYTLYIYILKTQTDYIKRILQIFTVHFLFKL